MLAGAALAASPTWASDAAFGWSIFDEFRPDAAAVRVVARPGVLNLRTGDVDTTQEPNELNDGDGGFDAGWRVLVMDGPMTPERRAALEGLGVKLGDYLPSNAWIADVRTTSRAALRGLGFVKWSGVFRTQWKLDPELGALPMVTPERQALAQAGRTLANVILFPGEDVRATEAALAALPGVKVFRNDLEVGAGKIVIELPVEAGALVAAMPQVQLIEDAEEWTERSSKTVRWVVQTNVSGSTPFYTAGVTGAGQVLSHLDTGVAWNQCAFYDTEPIGPTHRKVLADFAGGTGLHGTMTASILAGKNPADPTDGNTGVAYDAKLVHDQYPDPKYTTCGEQWKRFYVDFGAAVHSNSWGQDATTEYKAGVREVDRFSFEYDDNLIVFSVTNTSNALYIPENAKNCLAVSATAQAPLQGSWGIGGSGPTIDGRRKPELLSPGKSYFGSSVPNQLTNCGIVAQAPSGTSFACPSVAGAAGLVRQYFMDGYYPTGVKTPEHAIVPSGALMKAVLINGGDKLSTEAAYPNNRAGWGRVLLDQGLYLPGDARRTVVRDVRNNSARSLTTGTNADMIVRVNTAQLLRFTLVWHDFPASVSSSFTPVNNLDLIVTDPNGVEYRGNVFANNFSTTGGAADSVNNVEQVHIAAPSAGVWKVRIAAGAVNMESQGFAIVASGDISPCVADVNQDGQVDLSDFFQFFGDFDTGSAGADVDDEPGVDLGDFFAFLNGFDLGC